MIRGYGGNVGYIREKYAEMWGYEWQGIDYHLSELVQRSTRLSEVLARMQAIDIPRLPDDPNERPLGQVADRDLLAEIAKRPDLFT